MGDLLSSENVREMDDNIDSDNEYEAENEEREEMGGTQKVLILLTIKLFALYIINCS